MNTLFDNLASQLQGDTLTQLSRQVGADEDATSNAIAMALPVLLAGLARNAATPTGTSPWRPRSTATTTEACWRISLPCLADRARLRSRLAH